MSSLDDALRRSEPAELVLGGGNALEWPHLPAFLAQNRERERPQRIWLEAPARALTDEALTRLQASGAHGVVVFFDLARDDELPHASPSDVIDRAEARGLSTAARVTLRPSTVSGVADLAERLAPRQLELELAKDESDAPTLSRQALTELLLARGNLRFSGGREVARGYLPPCALPRVWAIRPEVWREMLRARDADNVTFDACASCALSRHCHFEDSSALDSTLRAELDPARSAIPWEARRREVPLPASLHRKHPERTVACTAPWTTMDVGFSGRVVQCCSSWTLGDRGHFPEASLEALWNAEGFQRARRLMSGEPVGELCRGSCPRLFDRRFEEERFRVVGGSEPFVRNQLLLAEDISERREVVRGKPIELSVGPSTYCNYDCIMCVHGRTPRVDLDERLWDELPALLPTLRTLTLLGGEPLANPRVMRFFQEFDAEAWPDVTVDLVTNGSLLTARVLERIAHCAFGDLTISLNAGSADVYARIMRKGDFQEVLDNLDALLAWRAGQPRWFGVSLSLVVQPANGDDLVAFGRRALERNLRIRLIPLDPTGLEGLDFYADADAVARVREGLDRLAAFADRVRPEWRREIDAARQAIASEAATRAGHPGALRVVR